MEKTTIIICHWQGNLIYRCLKSLGEAKAKNIVVTTVETFKKPSFFERGILINVLYLIPSLNNPAFKRNQGARLSQTEYLCFLDDDAEIKYDCIQRMEGYLDNHSDVGMVYAMLYKMDNHNVIDTSGSFMTWCGFLYETYVNRIDPIPILSGKSALCIIRKELFNKIGGFDEDFVIYGEETDLSWRVWLAGYKVMVLPSAIGYHAFETVLKPKSYYNQHYIHYHGCKNYLTMLIKNLPTRKLYIVLINATIWFIIGLLMFFRNKQASKWIMQGLWYNIKNFKYIWRKRQGIYRLDNGFYRYVMRNPSLFYYLNRCKEYLIHELHG